MIDARQSSGGWGSKVIARLAGDLRTAFPEMKGFSPRNLTYMRTFAAAWPNSIAQHAVAQLPWLYVLDFLAMTGAAKERELEQALVDRIIHTLRELGDGYAFVGKQVHFEVDGDDFFVDLLFFHVEQLRYIVVELKSGKFSPEHLGQLGFYVALVDDKLRRPQHAETVGLLLVSDKNDAVVRYSLGAHATPIGVAGYEMLPPAIRGALPSEGRLLAALAQSVAQ
ncbi:hypothetical protein GCM10009851_06720 [Herbiconiux moechotypicola]|uniref:YhcG PDDEXK nuclease domain-containing protein n=1 Tax=Herbiconiux moechotypicola TaxID=637393 RepID=A0ABN3DAG2_9MICO